MNSLKYYKLLGTLLIGRNSGDIQFPTDSKISGKHALISLDKEVEPERVIIQDLDSKNKTVLNRSEIPPHEKIPLKFFKLIEIGEQQFVLADSEQINLQLLDEMIKEQLRQPVKPMEPHRTSENSPKKLDLFADPNFISGKEKEIKELKLEIEEIERNAKSKVAELDKLKETIIKEAKAQIIDLSKRVQTMQQEMKSIKDEQERLKLDIEQKKKKIINLKDFDS